jgi:hypothetical protein
MQFPRPLLHDATAAGAPLPPTVPKVKPPAA